MKYFIPALLIASISYTIGDLHGFLDAIQLITGHSAAVCG